MGRHIESLIINQEHLAAPKTNVERSGGRQHLVKVLQELVGSCPGAAAYAESDVGRRVLLWFPVGFGMERKEKWSFASYPHDWLRFGAWSSR